MAIHYPPLLGCNVGRAIEKAVALRCVPESMCPPAPMADELDDNGHPLSGLRQVQHNSFNKPYVNAWHVVDEVDAHLRWRKPSAESESSESDAVSHRNDDFMGSGPLGSVTDGGGCASGVNHVENIELATMQCHRATSDDKLPVDQHRWRALEYEASRPAAESNHLRGDVLSAWEAGAKQFATERLEWLHGDVPKHLQLSLKDFHGPLFAELLVARKNHKRLPVH